MWTYTLRRVLAAIPTVLVVITVCYLLLHATPGGPFDSDRKVSAAVLANLEANVDRGSTGREYRHVCEEREKVRRACAVRKDAIVIYADTDD